MARIAWITDRHPQDPEPMSWWTWYLALSLAQSQHEVLIITDRAVEDEFWSHSRLKVATPFRTHEWHGIWRLMPTLSNFRPDIVHFVEPRVDNKLSLFTFLPAFIPGLHFLPSGRPTIASTVYSEVSSEEDTSTSKWFSRWRLWFSSLLPFSDLLFVSGSHNKRELNSRPQSPIHQQILVLPPPLDVPVAPKSHWLWTRLHQPYVLIPGSADQAASASSLVRGIAALLRLNSDWLAVVEGGWGHAPYGFQREVLQRLSLDKIEARVLFPDALDWPTRLGLTERCELLSTTPLKESEGLFMMAIGRAQKFARPLLSVRRPGREDWPWLRQCDSALDLEPTLFESDNEPKGELPQFAAAENLMNRAFAASLKR